MDQNARIEKLKAQRQRISNRIAKLRNVERTKERKRRTRRLILLGTYVESKTKDDQEAAARLLTGLDGFFTRPRDRELFGLPPREEEDQ